MATKKRSPRRKRFKVEGDFSLWVEAEVLAHTAKHARELVEAALNQRIYIDNPGRARKKDFVPAVEVTELIDNERAKLDAWEEEA